MLVLYKIFLCFLLKGGAGVLKNDPSIVCETTTTQTSFIPNATILNLQGDPTALEEAIDICEAYRPADVVRDIRTTLPAGSTASVRFDKIAEENRSAISRQLILRLTGRLWVEWKVEE